LPLVFDAGGALLAVADLWISENGAELFARASARLDWHPGSGA
jgi:hypothetical protein